jgi:hypothetical protein
MIRLNPFRSVMCAGLSVAAGLAMEVTPAFAGLLITQTTDIAAGQAAFGTSVTLFDWNNFFAAGTPWSYGSLGPSFRGANATDPSTGNIVIGSTFNLANWIDGNGFNPNGVGFNAPGGAATPDLALDGVENFALQFTNPITTIGFAIATGLGNDPGQFENFGTVFQVTTNTGEAGTLTLDDSGQGYSAWVSITAAVPFQTLTFLEPPGRGDSSQDQYFGNIRGVAARIPEPPTFALLFAAFGLIGFHARRMKPKLTANEARQAGTKQGSSVTTP